MNGANRNERARGDIAAQWRQAVLGDAQARGDLLRRIMPARSHRKAAPRGERA
jgi:hypothetical protein